MAYRVLMFCLIVIIVMVTSGKVDSAACEGMDKRCPCVRYTYKMATYNDKCFQFYFGTKTWKEAKDYCVQQGGRLAMLNDANTYQFVRTTLNSLSWNTEKIWIGAHDMVEELKWQWTNKRGEPDVEMTWSRWAPEHPEDWFHDYKDCVVMKKDDGQWKWHEAICHKFPFEYRFICEYDMSEEDVADPNEVGGVIQNSNQNPPTHHTTPPPDTSEHGNIRHSTNHGEPPRGDHRKVTQMDANMIGSLGEFGNQRNRVYETTESKDGHVPMYAVILAFVCGTIFALFIVIFIVVRRRKRKRKAADGAFPTVEYHHHPGHDVAASADVCASGGAVGGALVCETSGKMCKVAVDMGAEACACASTEVRVRGQGRVPKRNATPNVYVSVGGVAKSSDAVNAAGGPVRSASEGGLTLSRFDSPTNSSITSSMNTLNEAPPTYDEACADIIQEHISSTVTEEGAYINENTPTTNEVHQNASTGAIPKSQKTNPTAVYLPMDGSANNSPRTSSRNSSRSSSSNNRGSDISITQSLEGDTKDTSQYMPMSLGELPPIPTDQGYEIPVSRRPNPEAVRQARPRVARPESTASTQGAVYAEIPDRASRALYQDDEQIYSTID